MDEERKLAAEDSGRYRELQRSLRQCAEGIICGACGGREWNLGDVVAGPWAVQRAGTVVGSPRFPMVELKCSGCGRVTLRSIGPFSTSEVIRRPNRDCDFPSRNANDCFF